MNMAANLDGQGPQPMASPLTSSDVARAKTAKFLSKRDKLSRDIDRHPQADVRPRHGRLRAIVAHYLLDQLTECEKRYDRFILSRSEDLVELKDIMEESRALLNEYSTYPRCVSGASTDHLTSSEHAARPLRRDMPYR
jgi:hypothetical protein